MQDSISAHPANLAYSAPKLILLGDVSQLTASGSGAQLENAGNQAPTRRAVTPSP